MLPIEGKKRYKGVCLSVRHKLGKNTVNEWINFAHFPSSFGCCSDGEIPASGSDGDGCDDNKLCAAGPFGCCPDDLTFKQGPKNQGCFECPEEVSAICASRLVFFIQKSLIINLRVLLPDLAVRLVREDRVRLLHRPRQRRSWARLWRVSHQEQHRGIHRLHLDGKTRLWGIINLVTTARDYFYLRFSEKSIAQKMGETRQLKFSERVVRYWLFLLRKKR